MGKRAAKPRAASAEPNPTLAASSAVQRRAVELYRVAVPGAGPALDEDAWKAAVRQARFEIEGVER